MSLLKKENSFINALLIIITFGVYSFIPAYLLGLLDKNEWYYNKKYWLFGLILFIVPAVIMLLIFIIQVNIKLANYLKINGSNIYNNPYIWITLLIIPVIGWTFIIVMYLYLEFFIIINVIKGNLE